MLFIKIFRQIDIQIETIWVLGSGAREFLFAF
jgi:hypothetical protein